MSGEITDIKFYLPKKKINIKNICKKYKWPYEKTLLATGIKYRYETKKNETALQLALSACKFLKSKNQIDALIYVTQSPEYLFQQLHV